MLAGLPDHRWGGSGRAPGTDDWADVPRGSAIRADVGFVKLLLVGLSPPSGAEQGGGGRGAQGQAPSPCLRPGQGPSLGCALQEGVECLLEMQPGVCTGAAWWTLTHGREYTMWRRHVSRCVVHVHLCVTVRVPAASVCAAKWAHVLNHVSVCPRV